MQSDYTYTSKESETDKKRRETLDKVWNSLSDNIKGSLKQLFEADISFNDIKRYICNKN